MEIFGSQEIVPPAVVKERIMEALVQGKDTAKQLQFLLRHLGREGSDVLAHELASKILWSFTNSLSELSAQYPLSKHVSSAGIKEGSAETRARRGCYKRRNPSQTRTMVASTIKDDHAWRKYGQKEIQNSKFPRSYFRCRHKYDQSCKAIKQVQMMEENPSLYEITYIDVHTCTDVLQANPTPQMTEDSSQLWDIQSYGALSNTNPPEMKEDRILFSSSSSLTDLAVKEEAKDMEINSLLMESEDLELWMDFLLEDDVCNISMFNY